MEEPFLCVWISIVGNIKGSGMGCGNSEGAPRVSVSGWCRFAHEVNGHPLPESLRREQRHAVILQARGFHYMQPSCRYAKPALLETPEEQNIVVAVAGNNQSMCTPLRLKLGSILGFQRRFWKEASVMWFVLTICGRGPVGSSLSCFRQSIFVFLEKDVRSSVIWFHPSTWIVCIWPLASACSTVMSGAFSDGHSKYLSSF